jgi:imidazolonepropionase-like amidohydrolase
VRQAFYDGADLIKVIVNTGPRVVSVDELTVIVEEAHRVGKRVAAHATNDQATRIAAEAGVNSIEHGYQIPDDALKVMHEKNIYLVATDYPDEYYNAPGQTRGYSSLLTLQAYQQAGMPTIEVLRAATVNSADLLGWGTRIGSIEAGKYADIIAVRGDPLKDVKELEHVQFVMKGGEVIRNDFIPKK